MNNGVLKRGLGDAADATGGDQSVAVVRVEDSGQRLDAVAPVERGAVSIVMRLGLAAGIGDQPGDLLKVVLPGFKIAHNNF